MLVDAQMEEEDIDHDYINELVVDPEDIDHDHINEMVRA